MPRPQSIVNVSFQSNNLTGRHGALLALLMVCGLTVVGQLYLTIPLVAAIGAQFGVEPGEAALSGTAFGIAYAAGFLIFGGLSDRFGRKRVIVLGLAATALATLLVGLMPSFGWLLAARALQGLCASIFPPAALSLVTEELPPPHRPLGVSLMSFAFLVAAPAAQLLAASSGLSLAALMLALAPGYLLGALGLWFAAAAPGPTNHPGAAPAAAPATSLLRDGGIIAAWAAALTVLFGFVCFFSGVQATAPQLGVDPQAVRLFGLPALAFAFAAAPLARSYGPAITASFGLVVAALALGLAALALPTLLLVASALLSAGVALAVPGLIATVANRASACNRARALAIYTFALFLGASLAPPMAQWLATLAAAALWLVPAVLLLVAALGLIVATRRTAQPS
ncbi:MAG: MFS transporter [Rhodopseudomonas palustris]|nr:MAG: MFS transporter [Rhodopseudomonas palustris]